MEIALRRQLLYPQMDLFRRGFCFEGDGSACLEIILCRRMGDHPLHELLPRIFQRGDN